MSEKLNPKVYVAVKADFNEEGIMLPRELTWEDGTRYKIDRVLDRRQAWSPRTGGKGMRYTICVEGRATFLYFEGPRWFVEARY
jgi:hypothetical protein